MNRAGCVSSTSRVAPEPEVFRYSASDDDSGCVMDEYAWIPNGAQPDTVHSYFGMLPEDKVPYVNSAGDQWRRRELQKQLPPQDANAHCCKSLTPAEAKELEAFEAARRKECLGRGSIIRLPRNNQKHYCHQCKTAISTDELVISAPDRFADRAFWHPKCFICVECQELLVDLIFFKYNENVFCGRHHAEQIKPRCSNCDELIFSEECTEAEGRVWHMNHFVCTKCECQLGGQRYIVREEKPFCIACYNSIAHHYCATCCMEIDANEPHITQASMHWHANERCFCCSTCSKKLLGKRYVLKQSRLFCAFNCAQHSTDSIGRSEGPSPPCSSGPPSSPSVISMSPARVMRNAVNSSRLSPESILKSPSRVRFNFARDSRPHPPLRDPPPPPIGNTHCESIYETVALPTSSMASPAPEAHLRAVNRESRPRRYRRRYDNTARSSSEDEPAARGSRRSRSVDGRRPRPLGQITTRSQGKEYFGASMGCREKSLQHLPKAKRNFYARSPKRDSGSPSSGQPRHYSSSSSTSSESDSEDEYLSHYLASSLPRREVSRVKQLTKKASNRPFPANTPTPRIASTKANSRCIVS